MTIMSQVKKVNETIKVIYSCGENIEKESESSRAFLRYISEKNCAVPVFVEMAGTYSKDAKAPERNEFLRRLRFSLIEHCDELWYFGNRVSLTMAEDICHALEQNIPVKYIPSYLYEIKSDRKDERE